MSGHRRTLDHDIEGIMLLEVAYFWRRIEGAPEAELSEIREAIELVRGKR